MVPVAMNIRWGLKEIKDKIEKKQWIESLVLS